MGGFRGVDSDLGWIRRRFEKIEKAQREERSAKRAQATTVGSGGITIKDRGTLATEYAAGGRAVIIGPVYPDASDEGSQIALLDETGQVIFNVYRLPVTVTNPVAASAVYMQGDFVYLLSKNYTSQVFLDDNGITLTPGANGVRVGHTTTGSAANTVIDAVTGQVQRSTSSLRYKQDVEPAVIDPADVLALQPKTWRDKGEVEADPETTRRHVGLIAEDLDALDTMRQFVVYNEDGEPDAIAEPRLVVALLELVKDQERRVVALESADERPTEA